MATQAEIDECYEVAVELAKRAGAVARKALHRDKAVTAKSSSTDMVTETDQEVEKLIISTLKQKFPAHCFIGEESVSEVGRPELTDDPTWMIDPIDGTTNFVHRFPYSAVSIGFAVNKEPVVGVVYNFNLDQLFAAKKGSGATMNGDPIHVSQCTEMTRSMILTEMGYNRKPEVFRLKTDTMYQLAVEPNPVHAIHSLGSAALSMCMVASGGADVYYENGIYCWDIAAGDIILREAGGTTLSLTGDSLDLMRRGILCASTDELARQLVPYVKDLDSLAK